MKRDFLEGMGLEKEAIDKILDENSADIEATKAKYAGHDELKGQLAEANKAIESFKAMDIDGIKAAADEWKQKAERIEQESAQKLADMAFNSSLTAAINAAKGKSDKAVTALLDVESLKASKNLEADIKAAIAALKESDGYLFETEQAPPPYASGTGTHPMMPPTEKEQIMAATQAAMGIKTTKE